MYFYGEQNKSRWEVGPQNILRAQIVPPPKQKPSYAPESAESHKISKS